MSKPHILPRGLTRRGQGEGKFQDTQRPPELFMSSTHRVTASGAELKDLEAQALNMSLTYAFVTPLTHMVVTKPEGQEQFQVAGKPMEVGECRAGIQPPPQESPTTSSQVPNPAILDSNSPRETHLSSLRQKLRTGLVAP